MKIIIISKSGHYTTHGIGFTEHKGYSGTSDNRMSQKLAISTEQKRLNPNEKY